jgi:hypothetical protein
VFFDRDRRLRVALILTDASLAAISMGLAAVAWASEPLQRWVASAAPSVEQVTHAAALAAVITPLALHKLGVNAVPLGQSPSLVVRHMLRGTLVSVALLVVAGVAFGTPGLNAGVVGLYAGIQFAVLTADRLVRSALLHERRRRGGHGASFVVVGSGPRARRVSEKITRESRWGMRNLGYLDDEPRRRDVEILGDQYLGTTKEISTLLAREVVDEVFVAVPRQHLCNASVAELVELCELVGIDVTIASDLFSMRRAQPRAHHLLEVPGMTLSNYPHRSLGALAVKRAIDIVGATTGLIVLLPLWIVLAVAIKLESPGPVFFVQRRSTVRGRTFPFRKFRTMYADAEARLESLRERNEVSGPVFKIKDDPRVTPLGRVLRKYSLDELPQLLNVLAGHPSGGA